jgi:hypothetical protein
MTLRKPCPGWCHLCSGVRAVTRWRRGEACDVVGSGDDSGEDRGEDRGDR